VANNRDLKTGTAAAPEIVDAGIMQHTWGNIEYHLHILHVTNGSHVEYVSCCS
jgi:hypothetical protein